jgi:hypothetical protein
MMTMTNPITPPPKLIEEWWGDRPSGTSIARLATQAAQWGADQELEACCEVLDNLNDGFWSEKLRAARRPKPPSLKEQALHELGDAYDKDKIDDTTYDIIRAALESQ